MDIPKELYPFESRFFKRNGCRMHYLDEGKGDPVVMLHGNPTWSFYFRRLARSLRGRHRVIVPDHIGCGLSDKPETDEYPYTLDRRVADLEALLGNLGVKKGVTLVLHDWGGMIGMVYASRYPERIKRLVLLNTAAFHLPRTKPFPWQLRLCRSFLGALLVRGLNLFCRSAARLCAVRRPLDREVRRAYLSPYDSWKNRAAVLRFVQDIPLAPGDPGYDLVTKVQEGLKSFRKTPTLICWGERDFVFDTSFLHEWKRYLPEADVHSFADCGHYVLEDAADEIVSLVDEFLEDTQDDGSAPGEFVNIASHLPLMAELQPDSLAVALPEGRGEGGAVRYAMHSYRKLENDSNRIARGLEWVGVRRGTRTALMVPPGPDFFALTFALFKVGAVPVLIDPGIGIRYLKKCLAEAKPEAFIGIPKAHVARILMRWASKTIRTRITVGARPLWGGWTLDDFKNMDPSPYMARTRAEDVAAILFTSGSTGTPKGAVYTHGVFTAQVEMLKRIYGIEPGEVDLPTFPLFALFGPALGMSAVIPEMDATRPGSVDPENIIDPIVRFKVTQMFGSPALIDRVGRAVEAGEVKLPTLKRVISAGAPVSPRVLKRFSKALGPGVEIFTPYGATEALPVSSIGSAEVLGETAAETDKGAGVCVGRPAKEMRVEIIRISDDPIPEWFDGLRVRKGEIGEIAVKGPIVTREYFNRPRADELAKITDPAGGFFHRMGDLGRLDERGRLWMCGRKSHRVRTKHGELYTVPCEAVFNTHPDVFRTALVGVPAGGEGVRKPVLCVELEPGVEPGEPLTEELLALGAKHEHTRGIGTVLYHKAFPVDIRHNAKIFREKLAVWAEGRGA